MKLVVFSDLHLTNSNPKFKTDGDGVSDLLKDQVQFVRNLVGYAEAIRADGILFLGDITDRSTLDPITQTYFNRCINLLVQAKVDLVILLEGNHCTADEAMKFSVLGAASEMYDGNDRHFVTGVETIDADWFEDAKYRFHTYPYISDYRKVEEDIARMNAELDEDYINILLFHFPCINAQLDNGVPAPNGVNLSHEITDRFTLCLGGDFHRAQYLAKNSHSYYVGAPFSLKFNENPGLHGSRGFAVVTIDNEDRTFEIEHVVNELDYTIQSVQSEDVEEFIRNHTESDRVILQVVGEVDPETMKTLRSNSFYKLSNSKARSYEQPSELSRVVIDADSRNDSQLLSEQLADVDEEVKECAMKLFMKIQSSGD